jgi:hypothetical protein
MLGEINAIYLEKWKDFPGPDIVKYAFAIIGLYLGMNFLFLSLNLPIIYYGKCLEVEM